MIRPDPVDRGNGVLRQAGSAPVDAERKGHRIPDGRPWPVRRPCDEVVREATFTGIRGPGRRSRSDRTPDETRGLASGGRCRFAEPAAGRGGRSRNRVSVRARRGCARPLRSAGVTAPDDGARCRNEPRRHRSERPSIRLAARSASVPVSALAAVPRTDVGSGDTAARPGGPPAFDGRPGLPWISSLDSVRRLARHRLGVTPRWPIDHAHPIFAPDGGNRSSGDPARTSIITIRRITVTAGSVSKAC